MDLGFEVVELPAGSPPDVGEIAPDFERPLVGVESWYDETLDTLAEDDGVLLLFHPMIGSFPSTYIWQTIDERGWMDRFEVEPVGIVISTPYDIRRFLDERSVSARLFSDPGNQVAARYDVEHDLDGMAGITEPRPAVFLIDSDRQIQYRWVASEWPALPDYDEIETALESR